MVNRRWVQNGIPNFAFVLNRESLQAQGLVVWWPMLASHGANMLHDLVNSNNGVFNGVPIWKSDSQFGFVLDLDGTDDFVQNNDSFLSQITLLSPWTMAHWIIYDSLVGFSLGMSLAYRGGDDYASIGTSGSSTKIASAAKTPGTGATVSTGVWYHQTLVWDGTDLYSYLNGVFDYSVTPTSAIIWADLDTLVQGATIISGGSNAEVDGRVVDGRLYNRQLSAIEIYQLYAPQTRWELYQPVIYRSLPFVSAGLTLLKLENETVNVGDTDGLRFRILIRLLTDITNISETILSIRTLIRVLIEIINISEVTLKIRTLIRVLIEIINISEVTLKIRTLIRVLIEIINISELIVYLKAMVKLLSETLNISDAVLRILGLLKLKNEIVNLDDSNLRFRGFIQQIFETVNISENILRFRTLIRVLIETINIIERIVIVGIVKIISIKKGIRVLLNKRGVKID